MNAHPRGFNDRTDFVPESIEAEQQLLGAVLMNGSVLDKLRVALEPTHFYDPIHRMLFAAMKELRAEGKAVTTVSLKGYVPANTQVGDKSISEYLAALAMNACAAVMAPQNAEDIIKASVARDVLGFAQQAATAASGHWGELGFIDEIAKLTDDVRSRVEQLAVKDNIRPGDAYIARFGAAGKNAGAVGVSIGLKELSRVLNETVFEAGNLYGLLSSSGEGKTSLTIQIMVHALKRGHPVLFLSYDQSQSQCVAQMIAQEHGIDTKQQKDPENLMSEHERDQAMMFADWLNHQPIEIIRCRRESNKRLLAYAGNFIAKHKGGKTPLIVIDHIKKITPTDSRMSPDKIASEINVEWKSWADETHSAVFMLNQRNGEMNKRYNPRPIGRDLYGGEGAKEDYDAMIYLYRPAKYRKDMLQTASDDRDIARINKVFAEFGTEIDTVAELGVIKCRFGDPSQTALLRFEGRYTRYVSQEAQEPQGRML